MIDEVDDLEAWDNPEEMALEPLSELVTTGDRWEWVGRTGRELESWEPILTTELRAKLHPVEVAYYERRDVWQKLISHAARKIGWQPAIGGWTPEDIAQDALEAVTPLGFEVGGASWVKITCRVMNRKVADLLRAQTTRAQTTVADFTHDRSEASDFVPQVFSDDMLDKMSDLLTKREMEVVTLTYQDDLSNGETAERIGVDEGTVKTLLFRSRVKLSCQPF